MSFLVLVRFYRAADCFSFSITQMSSCSGSFLKLHLAAAFPDNLSFLPNTTMCPLSLPPCFQFMLELLIVLAAGFIFLFRWISLGKACILVSAAARAKDLKMLMLHTFFCFEQHRERNAKFK